jgi:signal transduction histidine kinase
MALPSIRQLTELRLDTLGGLLRAAVLAALFWALAALLLYLLAPGLDRLPRLLVFAECVGLTMFAALLLLRHRPWLARLAPLPRWALSGAIAIPAGYLLGHQLAFLLLGEPQRLFGPSQLSPTPILFTILIGGLGLYYFATRERLAQEAAARAEAQRLALESQLRLLRAQLEPHMLFNTLANLRSLLREDLDSAETMIDQLIVYLRSALAASQTEAVTLGREFAQLRAYLDIMALRMGPRLSFQLTLPAALESLSVPPMLLQPLVENAIKHGLEPKVGAGRIEVLARATDQGVDIEVSDNGLGLPDDGEPGPSTRPANASYGLQHVRDRLLAVYGPAACLSLQRRQPSGVRALVRIPR